MSRVIIIGGGIAGVSLGSQLAREHHVTVLEAERSLAEHSTGRSAALFLRDYGPDTVQKLTLASQEEFTRLGLNRDSHPLLTPRGALLTAWDAATAAGLATKLDSDPGLRPVTADEVLRLCPALRTTELVLAGYDPTACDIDVMGLHEAYVRLLRRLGGQTVTSARVTQLSRTPHGWRIRTGDDRSWDADVLVNAAGAWGDHVARLAGVAGHSLSPCRRTVVVARSARSLDARWPVVADAAEAWYFKPEGDGLLLSPADETPVLAGDVRPDDLDVASVLDRVNSITDFAIRSVQSAWAGLRTFAPDRVPVAGWHPDDSTLFCFVGQGGYGIQMAPGLAHVGADLFANKVLDDGDLAAALDPRRAFVAAAH